MAHVLRSLDLSYNELDEVPFHALKSLTSLDWLNFHRYLLTSQRSDVIIASLPWLHFVLSRDSVA
jgi:Leucine-rich repeat (LRR) protein